MNCKNVEPLLSLYVGCDLEEKDSRLVAAHLQSCTECNLAAGEYVRASQLLQGYEAPFITDEIYAGIREQVLNEIKRESHAPGIFSHLFLALVQPRMRWITAALLLAISVTALYLNRKPARQQPNDRQVAVQTVESNQAGSGADVPSEKSNESAGSSSFSNKQQVRMATVPRPITRKREAKAGVVASNLSRELVQRAIGVSQPSSAPGPVRVEMQTSDRNIRIIWLSGQRRNAGGSDGSKGT
jgi:putative zinc finger protein